MSAFHHVADLATFPAPGVRSVEVDQRMVLLVRCDEGVYCLDDVCTHDGGPLGEGTLRGCRVVCPRHGAQFDVRSGKALTMPATEAIRQHEVRIEDGRVLIKLND